MPPVKEYLQNITPHQKAEYERIRKIVLSIAPDAKETISYGIPTFKYKDTYLIYFGAFKNHMSVFPGAPVDLKDKLEGYKMRKGTIQFTEEKPLPDAIIKELVLRRLEVINSTKKK
jgi:uncharacterized protein YdhG (YjbR/CyaY superfamily)